MSEEIKIKEEHEHKCLCQSKFFKKFLITALGTFVGVYCALCLFTAIHKPPMISGHFGIFPMIQPCPCMMMHRNFKYEEGRRFEKPMPLENKVQSPFDTKRAQIED